MRELCVVYSIQSHTHAYKQNAIVEGEIPFSAEELSINSFMIAFVRNIMLYDVLIAVVHTKIIFLGEGVAIIIQYRAVA